MTIGFLALLADPNYKNLPKNDQKDVLLKAYLAGSNPQLAEIVTPRTLVKQHTTENEKEKLQKEFNDDTRKLYFLKEALIALNDHITSSSTDIIDNKDPANQIIFADLLVLLNAAGASDGAKDEVDKLINP